MANPWPDPHHQQDLIPSTSDGLNQAGTWQNATWPDAYTTIQGCFCWWCSATRHNDPSVQSTIEHQGPLVQDVPVAPYALVNEEASGPPRAQA
ncbi:hypothetical protein BJV74DRAFT_988158, partial [Russula compacta]